MGECENSCRMEVEVLLTESNVHTVEYEPLGLQCVGKAKQEWIRVKWWQREDWS